MSRSVEQANPLVRARPVRWPRYVAAILGLVLVAAAASLWLLTLSGTSGSEALTQWRERPPIEIARYLQRRLEGNPRLESLLHPALAGWRASLEREPPEFLADLGKGQRELGLSAALFLNGVPLQARAVAMPTNPSAQVELLASSGEIALAVSNAKAGTVLEVLPGSYRIEQSLVTGNAGRAYAPIVLRARTPGTVQLLVNTVQAVVVSQPYWIFENLVMRGVCAEHGNCEHAFHVVGRAQSTVIRNNRLVDFNAHLKVNGEDKHFPDNGLLQFNTLTNTVPRQTDNPTTPVDIVAADGWQLLDNRVENFVKAHGNQISYGMFIKGAARHGRIERNLVVCTPRGLAQPGLRVGISAGGGGTGKAFCRDGACEAESFDVTVASNIVAHCSDVGIDVFRGQRTTVAFNTLVNTLGILVRGDESRAVVSANVIEGRVRAAKGGRAEQRDNLTADSLGGIIRAADALDMYWMQLPPLVLADEGIPTDFCGIRRPRIGPPGAIVSGSCTVPTNRP